MLPVPVTYCNARWHASLYHMTVEVSVFCVLGVSYRSPHLFVSTVEGRLYRGSVDHHTAGNIYVVCFVMMSPPGSTCMDVEGADRQSPTLIFCSLKSGQVVEAAECWPS